MTDVEHALKPFEPRVAFCPGCGYSLQGLGEGARCPECGRESAAEELVLYGWKHSGLKTTRWRKRWMIAWPIITGVLAIMRIVTEDYAWGVGWGVFAAVGTWYVFRELDQPMPPRPGQLIVNGEGIVGQEGFGVPRLRLWRNDMRITIRLVKQQEYRVRVEVRSDLGLLSAVPADVVLPLTHEEAERLAGEIRELSKGQVPVVVTGIS